MTPHAAADCTPACAAECAGVASFPRLSPWSINLVRESRTMAEALIWRAADTMPDSAQSRRDALADAETLRRTYPPKSWKKTSVGQAAKYGCLVAFTRPWLGDPNGSASAHNARRAARAAFAAVPALRGEP